MSIRPYIGVESGAQLVPELSRLIGSATFTVECIIIPSPKAPGAISIVAVKAVAAAKLERSGFFQAVIVRSPVAHCAVILVTVRRRMFPARSPNLDDPAIFVSHCGPEMEHCRQPRGYFYSPLFIED